MRWFGEATELKDGFMKVRCPSSKDKCKYCRAHCLCQDCGSAATICIMDCYRNVIPHCDHCADKVKTIN